MSKYTVELKLTETPAVLDDTALFLNTAADRYGERSAGGHAGRQSTSSRLQAARNRRRRYELRYRRHNDDVLLRLGGATCRDDKPFGSHSEYQDEIRSAHRSHSSRRGQQ